MNRRHFYLSIFLSWSSLWHFKHRGTIKFLSCQESKLGQSRVNNSFSTWPLRKSSVWRRSLITWGGEQREKHRMERRRVFQTGFRQFPLSLKSYWKGGQKAQEIEAPRSHYQELIWCFSIFMPGWKALKGLACSALPLLNWHRQQLPIIYCLATSYTCSSSLILMHMGTP